MAVFMFRAIEEPKNVGFKVFVTLVGELIGSGLGGNSGSVIGQRCLKMDI